MQFIKAHTNGNDFVISADQIDETKIKLLSDRNLGIGCDQFILIKYVSHNIYDVKFFNQDGSAAKMCGNGACAAALYVHRFLDAQSFQFSLLISDNEYESIINENIVSIKFPMPKVLAEFENIKLIDTGNNHLIYEFDSNINLATLAETLNFKYPDYNLHFLKRLSVDVIKIVTFERGAGQTKACGSGAIAAAFSVGLTGEMTVIHEGGESKVIINNNMLFLKTKPIIVFKGQIL
ncbi:MAG: diaminopimelate epimerase [Holosporales bacterium]|jgi:diaminopimelate epimerase|nr:diaminopimelate epimerase [Holosporales bacterium]